MKQLLKYFLTFFFIFDIPFNHISTLFSTRKIAFILIMIFVFIDKKGRNIIIKKVPCNPKVIKGILFVFIITVAALLYSFIVAVCGGNIGNKYRIFSGIIYFCIYSLIFPIVVSGFYNGCKEFLNCIIFSMIAQTTLTWMHLLLPNEYRLFLSKLIYTTSNLSFLQNYRAVGIGASGAALSVILSIGIWALTIKILSGKKGLFYWMVFWYITSGVFISGRTGLVMVAILLCFIVCKCVLNCKRQRGNLLFLGSGIGLTMAVFSFIMSTSPKRDKILSDLFGRVASLFTQGLNHDFFKAFFGFEVPPFSIDSLVGSGISFGFNLSGQWFGHDSGYMKTYFALGILMAAFWYITYFAVVIRLNNQIKHKLYRQSGGLLIFITFLAEIKEPFILGYYIIPCLLFIFLNLRIIEEQQNMTTRS